MTEFLSPDDIATVLYNELSTMDLQAIRELPAADDMIAYHHTVGRLVRNRFLLWNERNPHTDTSDPMGDRFPDQVSHEILKKVWEKVNG